MRILIIILLIFNALYFIWTTIYGNPSYLLPTVTKEGIPTIELLPSKKNDTYKSLNSNVQSRCYTFGPFNSEKAARSIARKIKGSGLTTAINSQKTMQTLNFLVYLQAFSSRKQAEEVVQNIHEHKIKNYKIIDTGPYKNAISLGSFDNLDKARRHSEYIRFLGYDAKYTAQKKPKEVFWIEYDEPFSSNAPVMLWTKQIDPMASVQKIPKVCDSEFREN